MALRPTVITVMNVCFVVIYFYGNLPQIFLICLDGHYHCNVRACSSCLLEYVCLNCNLFYSVVVVAAGILKTVHTQQEHCMSLRPHITDLMIHNESRNDYFRATVYWDEPSISCEVDYKIDVFSGPELCNTTLPVVSENFSALLESMCDVCFIQVVVLYPNNQSDVVSKGPCSKVNITSYRLNSKTCKLIS